ncbi:unnamed protein product [Rhizophagus irregularis]|nr:unnamed protein product [Rhizophagus irregularis]
MPALEFLTVLFYQLLYNKFDAIEIYATYNTNNLAWKLYAIMGWMQALKERNLKDIPYILTDKDFAEINAAQTVWPEAHLQLCVWHIQRAIKQRLSSNKTSSYHSYNPKIAHEECSTIDPNWGIEWYSKGKWILWAWAANKNVSHIKTTMVVKSHWWHIKHDYLCFILVKKEWKQHEKKPTQLNGKYLTDTAKWIYSCPAYIKSQFFLCKYLVNFVEKVDGIFFKKIQRNGNYPLISSYEGELVNVFCLENTPDHTILNISITQDTENEDNYIIESDDEQHMYETDLNYLQEILNKVYMNIAYN